MSTQPNTPQLDEDQLRVFNLISSGANVFVSGPAGTGKSVLVEALKRKYGDKIILLAPTGVAAIRIGGQTVHSYAKFPIGPLDKNRAMGPGDDRLRELLKTIDLILIDEIGMLRSDTFGMLDLKLKLLGGSSLPFGGKQIVCLGDLLQISPITTSDNEHEYLVNCHGGKWAFSTKEWKEAEFETVALRKVHRQHDPEFVSFLHSLRFGEIGDSDFLKRLNADKVRKYQDVPSGVMSICVFRKQAELINGDHLQKLRDDGHYKKAKIIGQFKERDFPTLAVLHVKNRMKVMMVKNHYDKDSNMLYANGQTGEVVECVRPNCGKVRIQIDDGPLVEVSTAQWDKHRYCLR